MNQQTRLDVSCRVALAALLQDSGKFAERADIEAGRKQLEADLPPLQGEISGPFVSATQPDEQLQNIFATAMRMASGLGPEESDADHLQSKESASTKKRAITARQLTLFEQIRLHGETAPTSLRYRYALQAQSAESLFPVAAKRCESSNKKSAQKEYQKLWNGFLTALKDIPASHRASLSLWLDHFDSLWSCYTHAIPSATAFGVRPEVSLFDHSKTVAALATALWRHHHENADESDQSKQQLHDADDWDEEKLLIVQGDLFGIQDFIFASGGETQKYAAKLLRGRSFYVSLLSEAAALRVLDALALPPTSQIINAAGKFQILAPNTSATRTALQNLQSELDHWFLQHAYGNAGIGLAWMPVTCNDFRQTGKSGQRPFSNMMKRLFEQLENVKLRRFGLCAEDAPPAVFSDFLDAFNSDLGVCQINGRSPAEREDLEGTKLSRLAQDQIQAGRYLTRFERILLTRKPLHHNSLELPIFGYHISFTAQADSSGRFGPEAASGNLVRAWDFALPESASTPLWSGYARRNINGYIPRFDESTPYDEGRYEGVEEDAEPQAPKTFGHIACEDRLMDAEGHWQGISALAALKGDVDNLGLIFQTGLSDYSFAKMAALSRQVNGFFAIHLPWLCRSDSAYSNTYTVFAGGDDFFLIGPWRSQIRLAQRLRDDFARYVGDNPQIHFSAGLATTKPGLPVRYLAEAGEEALEQAKQYNPQKHQPSPKNAVSCFGYSRTWDEFESIQASLAELERIAEQLRLSTGYVYGLIGLVDQEEKLTSGKGVPQDAIWHSHFAYRTRRMLERMRGLDEAARQRWQQELGKIIAHAGIEKFAGAYKIALFTFLYQHRD
jgi:CRISPR-associated protein Csm1